MDSSRDQIEEIRSRLDIANIVGKYVQLKQSGKNFSGKCPFHTEKTPSFIVSPELQRYKCFGCGESGDVFNFVEKIENIDFKETLEKLAKEAGVELKRFEGSTQYQRLEEINKKAAIYFFKQLKDKSNSKVLEYIKNDRGITKDSIQNFGIGYAPGGIGLLEYIQNEKKYSKDELLLSGLFVEKEGKLRTKFFKRVMFPIRSSSGKVIAFTGRILPGNEYGPKYMNSPETPIYHKTDNLYGQYESRQEIRKQDLVIICEGTTDVISAHQIGIKNIVAPLGTALTKEQLLRISKLTKNVLFLFDSDSAGQNALEKAFILSEQLELNTYATNTLPYKDIDELIRDNPKQLKQAISKKLDSYTYLLINTLSGMNTNKYEDHQRIVSWMNRMLSYVKNRTHFLFYVESSYNLTKIEPTRFLLEKNQSREKSAVKTQKSPQPSKELVLLRYLLHLHDENILKKINITMIDDPNILEIVKYIKDNPQSNRTDILKRFENSDILKGILEDSIFSFSQEDVKPEEIYNVYNNVVREYYQRKEQEYGMKIKIAEKLGDTKEGEKLLNEFMILTKEKKAYEQNSKL